MVKFITKAKMLIIISSPFLLRTLKTHGITDTRKISKFDFTSSFSLDWFNAFDLAAEGGHRAYCLLLDLVLHLLLNEQLGLNFELLLLSLLPTSFSLSFLFLFLHLLVIGNNAVQKTNGEDDSERCWQNPRACVAVVSSAGSIV
jgi:hypothetical protein